MAEAVRETLEFEGWGVESCADGNAALRRIEGREHFDLFLFDNDLPELCRYQCVWTGQPRRTSPMSARAS